MRIIGGADKGRQIRVPKGYNARPTSDKTKETLFNILHCIEGKHFLDLFAGCGNVGIEALSRGAARAVFIEKKKVMANAIEININNLGYAHRCDVLKIDVARGIKELAARAEKFDVLFADPPYEKGLIQKTLQYLEDGRLCCREGVIVMQHSTRESLQEALLDSYVLDSQRKCGDTVLSFLKFVPGK
jgi:16S rRNA (guanine(966)-N(2))-methyltransferase RsmD